MSVLDSTRRALERYKALPPCCRKLQLRRDPQDDKRLLCRACGRFVMASTSDTRNPFASANRGRHRKRK